jgi:Chaperone of endosialidase
VDLRRKWSTIPKAAAGDKLNKGTINMKLQNLIHILIGIICIGLLPRAQAVVPPPDGGYPNFTTAEGTKALQSLTTGAANTAVGWFSLGSVTTGSFNTAFGAGTLLANTGDNNTATGAAALLSNTTGHENVANGTLALSSNTTGDQNTAFGYAALQSNTTTGAGTSGANTAVGAFALSSSNGGANTAIGYGTLLHLTDHGGNTALGDLAGDNITGSYNIAVGFHAGDNLTSGDYNIDIGNVGVAGDSATIRIGDSNQTNTYIGGIAGQTVGASGTTCYVDNDGKLGVFLSARRFKTDIADMDNASEALLGLRPVTFHYKPELDKTGIPQFGLIAEEVAKVNPDLVTHDANGNIYTVRYEAVSIMLLNEFLKEHRAFLKEQRKVEEQEAAITLLKSMVEKQEAVNVQQQKQIETVTAGLQKVGALVETSRPASQVVNNP